MTHKTLKYCTLKKTILHDWLSLRQQHLQRLHKSANQWRVPTLMAQISAAPSKSLIWLSANTNPITFIHPLIIRHRLFFKAAWAWVDPSWLWTQHGTKCGLQFHTGLLWLFCSVVRLCGLWLPMNIRSQQQARLLQGCFWVNPGLPVP